MSDKDKVRMEFEAKRTRLCKLAFRAGRFKNTETLKLLEPIGITIATLDRCLAGHREALRAYGPLNEEEQKTFDILLSELKKEGTGMPRRSAYTILPYKPVVSLVSVQKPNNKRPNKGSRKPTSKNQTA